MATMIGVVAGLIGDGFDWTLRKAAVAKTIIAHHLTTLQPETELSKNHRHQEGRDFMNDNNAAQLIEDLPAHAGTPTHRYSNSMPYRARCVRACNYLEADHGKLQNLSDTLVVPLLRELYYTFYDLRDFKRMAWVHHAARPHELSVSWPTIQEDLQFGYRIGKILKGSQMAYKMDAAVEDADLINTINDLRPPNAAPFTADDLRIVGTFEDQYGCKRARCFLAHNEGKSPNPKLYLIFQGSPSPFWPGNWPLWWRTNFDAAVVTLCNCDDGMPINVHSGFAAMLEALYNDIKECVCEKLGDELFKKAEWAVFGHSLGGALATLFVTRAAYDEGFSFNLMTAFPFCPAAPFFELDDAALATSLANKKVLVTNILVQGDIVSNETYFRLVGPKNMVQTKPWSWLRLNPVAAHSCEGRAIEDYKTSCMNPDFWVQMP
ncbi:uncharacterized protein MONBRDRAFT_39062 [Monosiga brevicollis MX1]|uniref:Fungal lipase-type domain-containing protein n=1 Tax=Monosiga brevicollis TaxID=81824 RepID=A9VBZ7_MONBE|nr:uncharacterized protein MONBRDRAFT_39062 [Monosiga brevicollis MX1]EDQ84937.1 predicted protein [Monosiga brevicollis MX1]|eukprot:XP_001750278.1 hypothetical protein [Monosiga brevicollis MX1]